MSIIDELKTYLQSKPTMKIAIYGHTDNVGNANDNIVLSQSRAKEVMEYLISQGIDAKRLAYEGFGANKPKASNATEEGRAINRRVEFIILEL
jgi:outer membrane protein OmpA-like peptidoglycan-associated protein